MTEYGDMVDDYEKYGGHTCRYAAADHGAPHECRCGLQWYVDVLGRVHKQAVKPPAPPVFELIEVDHE